MRPYSVNLAIGLTFLAMAAASPAFSQSHMERVIAVQQAEIAKLKSELEPVGTLVTSLLNEQQFIASKGSGWVLCDGRSVTGTRYAMITGRNQLPDCRGRFLRSTGGQAGTVGSTQNFATSVSGISVPERNVRTSIGHAQITLRTEPAHTPNAGSWVIDNSKYGNFLKGGGSAPESLGGGWQVGWQDQGHDHGITIPGSTLTGGSTETRPDNVAVNIFVRVN